MPQNKFDPEIVDGWYKNVSPAPVSLGVVTLAPGQVRFVAAARRLESRYTGLRFQRALEAMQILGPRARATDFENRVVAVVTTTPPEPVVIKVTETVQVVDEVKPVAPPAVIVDDVQDLE